MTNSSSQLPEVLLPGGEQRISDTAAELGRLLAATGKYYRRGDAVVRHESSEDATHTLRAVKPAALPSEFEQVARLRKSTRTKKGEDADSVASTCPESTARTILHSRQFRESLPLIRVISPCPVLIERDNDLVEVTHYDRASGILAFGDQVPEMDLVEAKHVLAEVLQDFHFSTAANRSRAMASLLTPALIFGGLLGGRAPVDLGEADKSQGGKGYRNKLTAAVYRQKVTTVVQRKGGNGSLEETFSSVLIQGKSFISFDNLRGKLDSPAIESFMTEDVYIARAPYSDNCEIDPQRVVVMMTSNRAETTVDQMNRSSCVELLKQPPDFPFKRYPEGGDLLDHVRANQPQFLGAVFAVIRAWHAQGKPRSDETGHDFRRWVQTLDWIVQELLEEAPLMDGHHETQRRIANRNLIWLRSVVLSVKEAGCMDEWLRTGRVLEIIAEAPEVEVPGATTDSDLDDGAVRESLRMQLGNKLSRCFQPSPTATFENLTVERRETTDEEGRPRKEYRVSRVAPHAPLKEPRMEPRGSRVPRGVDKHFSRENVKTESNYV